MLKRLVAPAVLSVVFGVPAYPQSDPKVEQRGSQPLYQVTIVSRTTKAINYGYLSAPTRIGFQGTPVSPAATGEANVEPQRGSTLLNIRIKDLPRPNQFGPQYLTYVVWAISTDGRAQNLGELITDGGEKARLKTSTPLQTFALIVTAEPYYAVAQPSEVVVMENVVTRDTIGKIQEVNATYELLPRKPYTYDASAQPAKTELVSPEHYEAMTALYQALNAIQIVQAQGADRYAPGQIGRARQLYNKARGFPVHLSKEIVSMAREAAQIAEDSRAIAAKRSEAEKDADKERSRVAPVVQEAPAAAPPALPPTLGVTEPVGVSPAARQDRPPVEVDETQFSRQTPRARENRKQLLTALPPTFTVVDSSRGIVITIPSDAALAPQYFSAIATAMKPYPNGLHVEVDAHGGSVEGTRNKAERIREELIGGGISPDIITARGHGDARPRSSSTRENRRVEIVIAGDAIGSMAVWDRTYTLQPEAARR